MSNADETVRLDLGESRGRVSLLKWGVIGIAVLVLLGAAAGAWYFFLGGREHVSPQQPREVETPLPFFFEVKPFVVTMMSNSGPAHFVQLGVSLQVPQAAGTIIPALLPEIQDSMRQTLLGFKTEEMQNPDGINKLRQAMIHDLNELLTGVLGQEREAKLTAGSPNGVFVQNILFATLIVE
jgi:flagellar basal body-associated protein FliL